MGAEKEKRDHEEKMRIATMAAEKQMRQEELQYKADQETKRQDHEFQLENET